MRLLIGGLLSVAAASANAAALGDVRLWDGPDGTRVVLDLGAQSPYQVFTLANPNRVVIDLPGILRAPGFKDHAEPKGVVRGLRSGPHDGGTRLVLDVDSRVDPRSFAMAAGNGYGYRLIVDLAAHVAARAFAAMPGAQLMAMTTAQPPPPPFSRASNPVPPPANNAPPSPLSAQPVAPPVRAAVIASDITPTPSDAALATSGGVHAQLVNAPQLAMHAKPIVIAVDAGHGGIDPGAHGPHGLLEKNVTLSIARKLAAMIDAQPGMHAVLTRDGDYFVDLRERTIKAREAQADLFISIHCNALTNPSMRGTAVYVLSDHGASNEQARWVANHENAADLVGGVNLQDKNNQLAAVLIDISQTATMEASFDLGNRMLDSLGRINVLQKAQVQQAGFLVLKSPDIPSVLVETAFITNDREEHLLADPDYQDRIANSLVGGVRGYFSSYRPLQQLASAEPVAERGHRGRAKSVPVSLARDGAEADVAQDSN